MINDDPDQESSPYFLYKTLPFILPDGAVCTQINITEDRKITEAYTEDGGHYVPTSLGLRRTDNTSTVEGLINYNSNIGVICGGATTRLSVNTSPDICYIIPTWGQSLAQGWSDQRNDILIATESLYPENCWMFKSERGVGKENPNRLEYPIMDLEPLRDTINGGWQETAASSIAAHIVHEIEERTGHRIRTISYVAAEGGKPYMDLTKGTTSWKKLIQGLVDARNICIKKGWRPILLAVDVMAGESDSEYEKVPNMSTERYKRQLLQFDINIQSEAKRIFKQTSTVPIIVSQSAYTPTSRELWDQPVRQAQYISDGIGNIRLCGPIFNLPSADQIHINSLGQNRRGQMVARAIIWEYFSTGWCGIRCVDYKWVTGNILHLIHEVPCPPLILDTSNEIIKTEGLGPGLGYIFDDYSETPPTIIRVAIVSDKIVEIELSRVPLGTSCRIGCGIKRNDNNTNNQDGPVQGARSVLRDSTAHISIYENIAHANWCPSYIMSVNR
ncbi:hypothetical protein [Serratia plymuthica]|uniref:hypothetical protein n=1 Tax=Serratia plymuthica TaxID=82996 RepID=UPI00390CB4C2